MACRYCFYNDEGENRSVRNYGMMDTTTSHALIDRAFADDDAYVGFGFQGGEPTLAGLDFFRDFVSYATSKAPRERMSFSLQTNGYAIDGEWADFFKENGFLVGLSLDGSKKCHDLFRLDHGGNGTFKRVFNNAKLLQRAGVDFNILVTTTRQVASSIDELYPFFKRNGFNYLQFTPCIDPIASERGSLDYSLTSGSFSKFLITLFRLYHRDWKRGEYVSIRYFDNLISIMVRGWAEECGMNGVCGDYYVVEADGSVYPCDFYVLDGYKLGNILTDSFEDLDAKRDEIGFVEESRKLADECLSCRWRPLCRGGCKRDRQDFNSGKLGTSCFCEAYKAFFSECIGGLEEIAQAEARALRVNGARI